MTESWFDNFAPDFNTYAKNYIERQRINGFSLEITHAFKVMLADYDILIQNKENACVPHCLVGQFYEPVNFRI